MSPNLKRALIIIAIMALPLSLLLLRQPASNKGGLIKQRPNMAAKIRPTPSKSAPGTSSSGKALSYQSFGPSAPPTTPPPPAPTRQPANLRPSKFAAVTNLDRQRMASFIQEKCTKQDCNTCAISLRSYYAFNQDEAIRISQEACQRGCNDACTIKSLKNTPASKTRKD